MFKNKKEAAGTSVSVPPPAAPRPPSRPAPRSAVPSIISADTTIHGHLHSTGDVQVEGAVVGDITATKLVIADGGSVAGNVTAKDVRICGALTGAVHGEMVTLTNTARVLGDIHHELLAIETGGRLEGMSRRLVPAQTTLPPPEADMAPAEPAQNEAQEQHHEGEHHQHDQGHEYHS